MSTRLSRNVNRSSTTLKVSNENTLTPKKVKSAKKIRRTNDLIHLDFSPEDHVSRHSRRNKKTTQHEKHSPIVPKKPILIPSGQVMSSSVDESIKTYNNVSEKKSPQIKHSNVKLHQQESHNFVTSEHKNSIKEEAAQISIEKPTKRKIVKAKRLLRVDKKETSKNLMIELDSEKCNKGESSRSVQNVEEVNLTLEISKSLSVNTQVIEEQANSFKTLEEMQSIITLPLKSEIQNSNSPSVVIIEQTESPLSFDSSKTSNLVTDTLPSPISPSTNALEEKSSPYYFDVSNIKLCPSLSGSVESSKHRTFELQDSTIDISILKSLSQKDSTEISSFPSEDNSPQCTTPSDFNFSKVTKRKRWEKVNFTPHPNSSQKINNDIEKTPFARARELLGKMETKSLSQQGSSNRKKFVSKIKVPNFAAIHQRALHKVENISDYKKRKDERARMLLSGLKPKSSQQKSSTEKESRKKLQFAANTTPKQKPFNFIPLPTTPFPRIRDSPKGSPISPASSINNGSKQKKFTPVAQATKPLTLKNNVFQPQLNNQNWVFKSTDCKQTNLNGNDQKWVFKAKSKQINSIKSIITKGNPSATTTETRRTAIKGVRSNRRFELLMNMRKGK